MILLCVAAGVSLSAAVVSWVNNERTAQVQEEIRALELQRVQMQRADAAARMQLLKPYLEELAALVSTELDLRRTVEAELYSSLQKARTMRGRRFGSLESTAVLRVTLELELSLSQVQAERVYLQGVQEHIQNWSLDAGGEVPAPGLLQLPPDFPRTGLFLTFDLAPPETLHGYRIKLIDGVDSGPAGGVLIHVDHDRRNASLSASLGALHEANLARGQFPLAAQVVKRDAQGVLLETDGELPLLLQASRHEAEPLVPESQVEVYPTGWTMDDLRRAGADYPLPVNLHPPVDNVRERWPCVPLALNHGQIPELTAAAQALEAVTEADPPWRMHLLPGGELAFSMGAVTLVTQPSMDMSAFQLLRVQLNAPAPAVSVRVQAVLSAFVPGTADDAETARDHFMSFLHAMHNELDALASRRREQQAALHLRKLSLIYQDQESYLRDTRYTGVAVVEYANGGRAVTLMLLGSPVPEWLPAAVQGPGLHRMRACNRRQAWDVRTAAWVNEHLGLLQLELAVSGSASLRDIDPQGIHRLELAHEGAQQQTLARALERTIAGRFASASVHATLMGLSAQPVANERYGREEVQRLLHQEWDVMAIWGPPGTGKTTTLVAWLLSLFQWDQPEAWPSILLTAPTHVAVNKLLSDLLEEAPWLADQCVRYCGAERIQDSGLEVVWHQNLTAALRPEQRGEASDCAAIQRWGRLLATREGRESAARWLLGARRIHAATCTGMARRDYGLWSRQFDIAIIDEAGKAFGAELMIPCSVARRVILVGDHNQLPPTVTSDSLDPKIGYRLPLEEVEALLEHNTFESIFEQLPPDKKAMLTLQYRMHADIGSLVSQLFYKGKLQSYRTSGQWRLTRKRLTFLDFSRVPAYRHSKARFSDSQQNATERAALLVLMQRLSQANLGEVRSLLVVCPYKAQRLAVLRDIAALQYSFQVDAATVDAVQGGEADIVILLMTRSRGSVQFLLDRHRLNVALSRARDAVIILGHGRCLTHRPGGPFERLLEIGRREGTLDYVQVRQEATWEVLAQQVSPGSAVNVREGAGPR